MNSPILPSVHTIAPLLTAFPASSSMSRHKRSLAASYASYAVRVHTRHGIKTLTFDVLAQLFTSTAKKAAEDLGISSRTLIRVCRSLGIRRWPYLGFRSEKNVERIRHEAMENLHCKLMKEGESLSTAILHCNAPNFRGASAKRLLKMPELRPPSLDEATPSKISTVCASCWSSPQAPSNSTTTVPKDDTHMSGSVDSGSVNNVSLAARATATFVVPDFSAKPLLSPPSTTQSFRFDLQRVSPCKEASIATSIVSPFPKSNTWMARKVSNWTPVSCKTSPIPSLDLLVDASILTRFKNEIPTDQARGTQQLSTPPRAMSMKDILTLGH
ncbi:Winged helix-turn-helix DNA-binding domain [Plasmopara halstedii]|uniref:Winged helix-turn-helix DNA-binding domain n=1 Tax=Plasmopara halstedii TaxID=4781 RepID=A0A0P1A8S1_PLAHL|nr:Winged helix-turn-helix DNA-binding domain [Plasmopara halstedii]CEG36892.1 Winged helix-turn-helix DNA-binding domain [Plasmopara halstedii]|eukprot:XP_024573261.1 Winged helix-turn-helix DNA-binding domain [Plasmopara halstedii]